MKRIIQIFIQPDQKVRKETVVILENFAKKYKAYKAFNDWKGPHVTVFTMEEEYDDIKDIIDKTKNVIKNIKPFKVYVKGTGYFMKSDSKGKRNYVIFLKIQKTTSLYNLWKVLNKNLRRYRVSFPKYVPHLTITRQDLKKKDFYRALKDYKNFNYSRSFIVKEVKISTRKRNIKQIIVHKVKLKN